MSRLAVRVTPDALRQIRWGHPWVYAESVVSTSHDGHAGDLAVVFDDRRRFVAIGLYDPGSPIRIKVLHHGRPAVIDGAWWKDRVADALARRADLLGSVTTTGYRVVHGENDGLPGLVVDRYAETCVLKLYSAALVPHLATLVDAIGAVVGAARIVLRVSRLVASQLPGDLAEGMTLAGPPPDGPVWFHENGLRLTADVVGGQKTGHFLDQRDNRRLVGGRAMGARVLDVFACTGGFALNAAAGGALSVHLVDQSHGALAAAEANRRANLDLDAVRGCRFTSDVGDAFAALTALAGRGVRYDLVVVDPPSFAQNQAGVERAVVAYRRLTALALDLIAPGGLLFQASCSSRVPAERFYAAVTLGAASRGRRLDELARTDHPLDHPIGFPQGAYLKALLARAP